VINHKYLWLEILKFNDLGFIPAIAQDSQNKQVLELIWLDKILLRKVIDSVLFMPLKYKVKSIFFDCDVDALILEIEKEDHDKKTSWIKI